MTGLVSQSSLPDPQDCSLPGSSVHGILQARILEWVVVFPLQGIFLIQGSNLCQLLHWQVDSLPIEPSGTPPPPTHTHTMGLGKYNYPHFARATTISSFESGREMTCPDSGSNAKPIGHMEGNGNPLQEVFLPGESHGQRSLAGHSPRGRKESGTIE